MRCSPCRLVYTRPLTVWSYSNIIRMKLWLSQYKSHDKHRWRQSENNINNKNNDDNASNMKAELYSQKWWYTPGAKAKLYVWFGTQIIMYNVQYLNTYTNSIDWLNSMAFHVWWLWQVKYYSTALPIAIFILCVYVCISFHSRRDGIRSDRMVCYTNNFPIQNNYKDKQQHSLCVWKIGSLLCMCGCLCVSVFVRSAFIRC